MKISCCLTVILFSWLTLHAVWTDIRSSSFTDENEMFFRYESLLTENTVHQLFYFQNDEWQLQNVDNIIVNTYEGVVPFTNSEPLSLSFRIDTSNESYIIPGYTTQQPVSLLEMTTLSEYERDIEIPAHLNIAGERMLNSENQLHFALTNFGEGFPVSDGTTGPFYSYTIALYPDSGVAPDHVFALLYTINLAPYINPGLFKIDAATEMITQIGSVSYQIDTEANTLFISCLLEDLYSDPDFAGSYSPDNQLKIGSLTQKIEDFGATITLMDQGEEQNVFLWEFYLEPYINNLPQIYNVNLNEEEETFLLSLEYFDPDGHFPLISEVELDSGNTYQFIPEVNDFSGIVSFSTLFSDPWTTGMIRFSDNASDIVEYPISNSSNAGIITPLLPSLQIFPNPFTPVHSTEKGLYVILGESGLADIVIYNLKGQKIFYKDNNDLSNGELYLPYEDLRNVLSSSGIYLIQVNLKNGHRDRGQIITSKFLYLR